MKATVFLLSSIWLNVANAAGTTSTENCPILGPVLPPATPLGDFAAVRNAAQKLGPALEAALAKTPQNATISFSVNMFSGFDNQSIFSYHHKALDPNISATSGSINDDTTYRIGSTTKLLTTYSFLVTKGYAALQDPITKYVPELATVNVSTALGVNQIQWSDITVEALLSQLSGIPRDFGAQDFAGSSIPGLPTLNKTLVPRCSLVLGKPCSRAEYLQGISAMQPVMPPFQTSIYSNAAFQITGYALETITGLSAEEILIDVISKPLGLKSTSYSPPKNNSNSVLVPASYTGGFDYWTLDLAGGSPEGGAYSSASDLTKIGQSILRSTLLPLVVTRKWMKPHGLLSDLYSATGLPWEIQRMDVPISNSSTQTRVLDLYTKYGDIDAYSAGLVLDADHNAGFTILGAGPSAVNVVTALSDVIAETMIPAFEQAARENAQSNYAGTFAAAGNSSSNITLVIDDRPGLGVKSWYSNGIDAISIYKQLNDITDPSQMITARLYPTGFSSSTQVGFRAVFEAFPKPAFRGIIASNCQTWLTVDEAGYYGSLSLDDFVIDIDRHGKAVSVEPRALRQKLSRRG
ncbi:MAG: hypothetical protein M1822_001018 [Bathelium mastoideum]|nr:MAG: hypothetical protein M1822_001018 [Bathelium mastoideum]